MTEAEATNEVEIKEEANVEEVSTEVIAEVEQPKVEAPEITEVVSTETNGLVDYPTVELTVNSEEEKPTTGRDFDIEATVKLTGEAVKVCKYPNGDYRVTYPNGNKEHVNITDFDSRFSIK